MWIMRMRNRYHLLLAGLQAYFSLFFISGADEEVEQPVLIYQEKLTLFHQLIHELVRIQI